MKKCLVIGIIALLLLMAFKVANLSLISIPKNWPAPVYDFNKNPLTAEKIGLGRMLFYDPVLSRDSSISCASCHSSFTAFAHVDHQLSHGIKDRIGRRNAPALMNLAWQKLFMWDGAVNHLDMQALSPISHPDEMDETFVHVLQKLQRSKKYRRLFYLAFDDSTITGEYVLKSISQFMLTLISSNSKYDSVMRKEAVFSSQERNGYQIFQLHCSVCHREPLFSTFEFENNGLPPDTTLHDRGRIAVSLRPVDSLKFKVPTLRNVEFTYPYMHDGRFKKLSEVLKHYTSGIWRSPTLSLHLQQPIALSSKEQVDLIAFLLTLTDRNFLFDKRFGFPMESDSGMK